MSRVALSWKTPFWIPVTRSKEQSMSAVAQQSVTRAPEQTVIDLEKMPVERVLAQLAVKPEQGLSSAEARQRLAKYGPNALVEKEVSLLRKIVGHFTGPNAYMIEAAAIVSAIIGHWDDFVIIAALLFFNAALEFWQDRKASNALAALRKGLAPEATAMRDGKWQEVAAATLVPGDIVKIRLGVIVPADLRLVGGDYASIDQAALTGESLPVAKKVGDEAYSGSVVKQGEMQGVVIATGAHTFFGRTAKLVAGAGAISHAQKAMFEIGNFLIILAVALALIMVAVQVYQDIVITDDWGLEDALGILQFVLVLLVASIPVAMPAVFSITMALGALALSKQKAIVSKLSAIEEMAGVDILCSDKTGTLTKNQLTLGDPILFSAKSAQDCILAAALASKIEDRDAIDTAVIAALKDQSALKSYKQVKFVPFDPVSKRTAATVTDPQGKSVVVSKGAPQVLVDLAKPPADVAQRVKTTVDELAAKGSRALAVARSEDAGQSWSLLGILPMFDPPLADVRPAAGGFQGHDRDGERKGRARQDGDRRRYRHRDRDRAPARHGHAHHPGRRSLSQGHRSQPRPAGDRRRHRAGGRFCPRVSGAQIRHRQGAAGARPPGCDDRRRRQRCAGVETSGLRHRRVGGHRRGARRCGAGSDRARAVRHQRCDRRGAAHLRTDHHLHDLPHRADHGHHVCWHFPVFARLLH